MERWIIELEPGVWIAQWNGDPGRTLVLSSVKRFRSFESAVLALSKARRYRTFPDAKIIDAALEPRPAEESDPATPSEEQLNKLRGSMDEAEWLEKNIPANRISVWDSHIVTLAAEVRRLRSQLARKDERMRDLVEEALGTIESTVVAHGWWSSWTDRARAALREPDGRKGE